MKIKGDLVIRTKADGVKYKDVTEVGGSLSIYADAKLEASALTSVGGSLYINANAKLPALTSVGGSLSIYADANLPALTSVGGALYIYAGAKLEASALTSVGEVRTNGNFLGKHIVMIDDIGCVVLSEKSKDGITIKYCQRSKFKDGNLRGDKFYVASKGASNAHGKTIKEATEELAFKTGERDTSQYKGMKPSTSKTPEEWAFVYRMITGACQYGTQNFMAGRKLKKKYTLAEVFKETKDAWGGQTFKEFFE